MLRFLPALAGLSLVVPATASAAPFGELPFQPVNGPAVCLQATGTAGELVHQTDTDRAVSHGRTGGPASRRRAADRRGGGLRRCRRLARWRRCAGVSGRLRGRRGGLGARVHPRARAGLERAIDMLPPEVRLDSMSFTVAASERGDALVASSSTDENGRMTVRVARRLPGGAFGAPEQLAAGRDAAEDSGEVRAGYGASGEAVVAWTTEGPEEDDPAALWATIAPPGARFGAPQRIATVDEDPHYALAVGADGRALAVFTAEGRLVAAERAPGGVFGPVTTIARTAELRVSGGRTAARRRSGRGLDEPAHRGPRGAHARAGRGVRARARARASPAAR